MLISFIITYHNEPLALLHECLQSILSLPLDKAEREVVVVDDGSDIPLELDVDGVKLIRQNCAGLSVARNTGIDAACGEYLQFVDADDALIESHYGHVLEALRGRKYDLIAYGFSHERNKASHSSATDEYDCGEHYMQTRNIGAAVCMKVIRRTALDDLRFEPGILHEDELFTPLLLMQCGRLLVMKTEAYYYRVRGGSITTSVSSDRVDKRLEDTLFVIKKLRQSYDNRAMKRRVAQLTMDYVYNVWRLRRSIKAVRLSTHRLAGDGLWPLPLRCYTWKYLLFAIFTRWMR